MILSKSSMTREKGKPVVILRALNEPSIAKSWSDVIKMNESDIVALLQRGCSKKNQ